MDIQSDRLKPGHLVIGALAVVAVHFTMVAATGFHPPEFRTGYDRPYSEPRETGPIARGLSPEARRELENILSPPPILDWSERTDLPSVHQSPQAATPQADPDSGGVPPEEDGVPETAGQTGEGQLALLDPPPEPEVAPEPAAAAPTPDIPDIDYGRTEIQVEPVYLRTLPDLANLSAEERKRQFIALMLPLVLRSNLELEHRRNLVLEAIDNNNLGQLKQWGRLYGYDPENDGSLADYERELLARVAPVPVSIAIAQAAVESGWGTSRFAVHGNALMGQWAWNPEAGIRPKKARYDDQVVRAFASLFDSVRAYMHNLNTHGAYSGFREIRDGRTGLLGAGDITRLVNQLSPYSEERQEYTDTLKDVIRSNDLLFYDRAVLRAE